MKNSTKRHDHREECLYRPNVCIVVQKAGIECLLMCHRAGFAIDAGWQFPQGGIDLNADLMIEMRRELREEIGTDDIRVIGISPRLYCYTLPQKYRKKHPEYSGQMQRWVLAEYSGNDAKINFSYVPAEFDAYEWVEPDCVLQRIVDFKYATYRAAMSDLGLLK